MLLLDHNISYKLAKDEDLLEAFPGLQHIYLLGLHDSEDEDTPRLVSSPTGRGYVISISKTYKQVFKRKQHFINMLRNPSWVWNREVEEVKLIPEKPPCCQARIGSPTCSIAV